MGFMNEPTAADYAWSDARSAIEKNRSLEARIIVLEKQVSDLMTIARRFHVNAPELQRTAVYTQGNITYWSDGTASQDVVD